MKPRKEESFTEHDHLRSSASRWGRETIRFIGKALDPEEKSPRAYEAFAKMTARNAARAALQLPELAEGQGGAK